MKKKSRWIYYISVYILVMVVLYCTTFVNHDEKSRNSNYYFVLIHNKNKNWIELHGLKRLKQTLQNYNQTGVAWSLLVPETEVQLKYDDGDTFYSVERISPDEQVIQLTYEVAIGNHPTVKYRVKNESVEPLYTFGLGNYFLAILVTILIIVIIEVFIFIVKAILWIKSRINI